MKIFNYAVIINEKSRRHHGSTIISLKSLKYKSILLFAEKSEVPTILQIGTIKKITRK